MNNFFDGVFKTAELKLQASTFLQQWTDHPMTWKGSWILNNILNLEHYDGWFIHWYIQVLQSEAGCNNNFFCFFHRKMRRLHKLLVALIIIIKNSIISLTTNQTTLYFKCETFLHVWMWDIFDDHNEKNSKNVFLSQIRVKLLTQNGKYGYTFHLSVKWVEKSFLGCSLTLNSHPSLHLLTLLLKSILW